MTLTIPSDQRGRIEESSSGSSPACARSPGWRTTIAGAGTTTAPAVRADRPGALGVRRSEPGAVPRRPASADPVRRRARCRPHRAHRPGRRRGRRRHARAGIAGAGARRPGRLLLRRVRHPRLAPGLLRRPGRPGRRHPEGGERRGLAMVAIGLLYRRGYLLPARRCVRLAAGVLARARPEELPLARRPGRRRRAAPPVDAAHGREAAFRCRWRRSAASRCSSSARIRKRAVARWKSGRLYEGTRRCASPSTASSAPAEPRRSRRSGSIRR